jgi:hypothetical protein
MNTNDRESSSEMTVPAPTVLTSWAAELHRLATSVEQSIQSKEYAPSVVSSLTAMTPIVNLLSDSLMTVVMNELTWPDSEESDSQEDPRPPLDPGYL